MTKQISRRQFIQLSALTGTAVAVSGCTINLQHSEKLEPYVIPPEEALPGESIYYATACRMCSGGCGILVRVSNGRARKIEGNPLHPLNAGKTCARAQAGLQYLYNPDRLQNAVINKSRGTGSLPAGSFGRRYGLEAQPVQWADALAELAQRIQSARPGAVAFYGSQINDGLAAIVTPFMQAIGGQAPIFYDTESAFGGRGSLARLMTQYFGAAQDGQALPFFHLSTSDVVFSFGGPLVDGGLSMVAYNRSYGEMRGNSLGKRGYLVQFEPRMSATGAAADEWVPILPGTEGLVALAIGRVMVDEGIGNAANSPAAGVFSAGDVAAAASLSGVPEERLVKLARVFGSYDRPTAIPGGTIANQANGPQAMTAILALNALVGHLGEQGSAFTLTPTPPDPAFGATRAASYTDVQALIDTMLTGGIDVMMIHGNPRHELPIDSRFVEALAKVPYVVSFSSEVDETTLLANVILPDNNYLESWGYQVVNPTTDRPMLTSQQPVVPPLGDTRATSDVFLALAQAIGGAAATALPQPNTVEFMKTQLAKLGRQEAPFNTANGDTIWAGWRQYGGWWPTNEAPAFPTASPALPSGLTIAPPTFEGNPEEFPLLLYPYPSVVLGNGSSAAASWLQEAPDPMTTASWDTWVEINPETAKELGVAMDEVVRVVTPNGEITVIVYVYPAIRPDVIAIPMGQGHVEFGRFAQNKGANVAAILAPVATPDGELAWGVTRARIEKLGRTRKLPRIENNVGVDAANQYEVFPG
jgi:anaerobic selenocysteine-containing dehydrogenase